jgi:hypothetical protein
MNAPLTTLPSAATLARLPERVLHLINGLGKLPNLASAMEAAGFTGDEAALGFSLLDRATNPAARAVVAPATNGARVTAALQTLAGEGMAYVRCVHGTLARHVSGVLSSVFAEVDPEQAPVLLVHRVLTALGALDTDPRPEAATAVALLERRGLGAARRAELAALVRVATAQTLAPVPGPALDVEARRAARDQALIDLYRWYAEWAEMARALARNRRELIVIGLARPRARKAVELAPESAHTNPAPAAHLAA